MSEKVILPYKVRRLISEYGMLRNADVVVAGVSGGADSICLFHCLRILMDEIGFSMRVVHVHHMIRDTEADRDAAFVQNLCLKYNIPCTVRRYDVPLYARQRGLSVEEAGRLLRREAFAFEAEKNGNGKIALAHHMNDVAETVLFNMVRGSGIAGLASLRPVRGQYIRPLMNLERREIEAWLKENGFPYITDSTNADTTYSRNRIRQVILPELTDKVNAQSVRHICEISDEASLIDEWVNEYVRKCLEKYVIRGGRERIVLDKRLFEEEKRVIAARTVKAALGVLAGTARDIGRVHIQSVCSLSDKENGKKVDLPYGMYAESVYDVIHIGIRENEHNSGERPGRGASFKYSDSEDGEEKCLKLALGTEKILEFAGFLIRAALKTEADAGNDFGKTQNVYTKKFDYDKICGILKIRYRMPGDYLIINPDGRRKSLSDYFTNCKIPRDKRDRIPLLACGHEILWVVGLRSGESCRIDTETRTVLSVTVEQKGGYNDRRDIDNDT